MRSKEFPHAPIGRIARKATSMRMSRPAIKSLRNYVLDSAEERAKDIVGITKHAGRKTVMKNDVLFVTRKHPV
jgi:histone H3/H4